MIFLDTDIILRYLTWDEPGKRKKCESLFKKLPRVKKSFILPRWLLLK